MSGWDTRHLWTNRALDPDVAWKQRALCLGTDPDLFFPDKGDSNPAIAAAAATCIGCPVRSQCLEYAIRHDQPGIWGGTTERERKRIRRARNQARAVA
jgi:WhiB family redox-sensing transcriptional regulator